MIDACHVNISIYCKNTILTYQDIFHKVKAEIKQLLIR